MIGFPSLISLVVRHSQFGWNAALLVAVGVYKARVEPIVLVHEQTPKTSGEFRSGF